MSGEYPDNAEYNKLVRDRIPEIIQNQGLQMETEKLTPEKRIELLKVKIVEEAMELRDAPEEEVRKEMSDVMEGLVSLAEELGIDLNEIEELRQERAEKRGRFKEGIYLKRVYKEC